MSERCEDCKGPTQYRHEEICSRTEGIWNIRFHNSNAIAVAYESSVARLLETPPGFASTEASGHEDRAPATEQRQQKSPLDELEESLSQLSVREYPRAFYAVKQGRTPGVYLTWKETEPQVVRYHGALHKKCRTLAEAKAFVSSA